MQDSATYKDKQNSAGVGVSICVPPFCYGEAVIVNVSAAKAKINSDYQSVTEQSGLKAGDGGFTVNVKGNTDLKGAAITSTQAAIDNNKNTFNTGGKLTTSDIENKASYEAKSVSVSISTGGGGAAGFGSDSGQASSTTKAAISGIAGDTAARTGDKEAGIKPIFDANKVKADVQLQTAVTSEFGRNASKAVGDYATKQKDALNQQASQEKDPAKKAAIQAEIAKWEEGGAYRVAAHTVVGGLIGGVAGAAGAGTSQAVIDQVGQALKNTDLPVELKQALVAAAGTAVGMAASGGSVTGGATAFNATTNNYLTTVDLGKPNRTKAVDIQTSLANNNKLLDACQGGASAACTQAQTKVQQDIQDLQDYKIALLSERNLSNDSATKEAISARIKEADSQIASANNQLETARLQTNGGNYFTKDLTGAQRETIGMALDPLQAAGVKATVKVVDTVTTVIDNAAYSAEQAAAVAKAQVELSARTDDAQQYINNNAPIQVPSRVTRNDNDFTSTVNARGNPKANIDDSGNLVAANPNGTGSPTAHVSGSNPANTPYISATDAASVDPMLGGPKTYGSQQITINARDLQRDINSGAASQDIKIINNQQLVDQVQTKVNAAQRRFDANPSDENGTALKNAQRDLNNAKRDGELLITPYVPPAYYTQPSGPVTPIVTVPKALNTPTTPAQPIK